MLSSQDCLLRLFNACHNSTLNKLRPSFEQIFFTEQGGVVAANVHVMLLLLGSYTREAVSNTKYYGTLRNIQ